MTGRVLDERRRLVVGAGLGGNGGGAKECLGGMLAAGTAAGVVGRGRGPPSKEESNILARRQNVGLDADAGDGGMAYRREMGQRKALTIRKTAAQAGGTDTNAGKRQISVRGTRCCLLAQNETAKFQSIHRQKEQSPKQKMSASPSRLQEGVEEMLRATLYVYDSLIRGIEGRYPFACMNPTKAIPANL